MAFIKLIFDNIVLYFYQNYRRITITLCLFDHKRCPKYKFILKYKELTNENPSDSLVNKSYQQCFVRFVY